MLLASKKRPLRLLALLLLWSLLLLLIVHEQNYLYFASSIDCPSIIDHGEVAMSLTKYVNEDKKMFYQCCLIHIFFYLTVLQGFFQETAAADGNESHPEELCCLLEATELAVVETLHQGQPQSMSCTCNKM